MTQILYGTKEGVRNSKEVISRGWPVPFASTKPASLSSQSTISPASLQKCPLGPSSGAPIGNGSFTAQDNTGWEGAFEDTKLQADVV